jgi:hypothetical protein
LIVLYNTTKTMDVATPPPAGVRGTRPRRQAEAEQLAARLKGLDRAQIARLMSLSPKLAETTVRDLAFWGEPRRLRRPALGVFAGLVFKHLDPHSLSADVWNDAQDRLRILSGLYGMLRPRDLVEPYRLEMGCAFKPAPRTSLAAFWKPLIMADLNRDLRRGEPVINLAAGEYLEAVDVPALKGPLVWPVFKQRREDGKLKVVTVYAKEARGLMARFILEYRIDDLQGLLGFSAAGWEAAEDPPASGEWLFTR